MPRPKVRESRVVAETRLEHQLNEVVDQLGNYNRRLHDLADAISTTQGVKNGSICLEFFSCGVGCIGCPHPRWVQYKWKASEDERGPLMGINLDSAKREPVLCLSRKSPTFEATAELMRQAKDVIKDRSNLIAAVRTLRSVAKLCTGD